MSEQKRDLRAYGNEELSLIFLNEQIYYTILMSAAKRHKFSDLKEVAAHDFEFTTEQLEDLKNTYDLEVEEYDHAD